MCQVLATQVKFSHFSARRSLATYGRDWKVRAHTCSRLVLMTLVVFGVSLLVATATVDGSAEPPGNFGASCPDWDERSPGGVRVLEGEAAWVRCPLLGQPSPDNLSWFRLLPGQALQQPITHSVRLSRERDELRFQPTRPEDSGCYACLPRSGTAHRLQMWVRVTVVRRQRDSKCDWPLAATPTQLLIPLQGDRVLDCPDWREAADMADGAPNVTWHHECTQPGEWTSDRQQVGARLQVHYMADHYQGVYACRVHYRRGGRSLHFTRGLNVTAVSPASLPKEPRVLQPTGEHVFGVKAGSDVRLVCTGHFPFLEPDRERDRDRDPERAIWWSVDGKTPEQLPQRRFSASNRTLSSKYGDRIEESVLLIRDFGSEGLGRTYNCSVKNRRGFHTRRARLEEEAWVPWLELAAGLSAILAASLALLALAHVFRLELLLLYRSCLATDERHTDDKEFDVYISYARNSEEEKFVLRTLRTVLENHLGYSVCIFDRDSLPGGTITEETLSLVARSRRLLVVLGPGYAGRGSQALLELKAGVDGLAGGHLRLILLQYERVRRREWVRELRRARVALATLRWRGERHPTARFWKKLRLEMPARRMPARPPPPPPPDEESAKGAGLMTTSDSS